MTPRMDISKVQPTAYTAMIGLENYLQTTSLTQSEKELIKLRASQINHCAFCIDMHTTDALKYGENPKRLFLLNAWRETNLYTEEEKIILQLTEAITLIHQQGVPNDVYNKAKEILGEEKLAQVIMAIVTINAWNRIAISTEMGFGVQL